MSVFSTYVEMILSLAELRMLLQSILHVCGDDPCFLILMTIVYWGILHVCGDDPSSSCCRISLILYSPRMWR